VNFVCLDVANGYSETFVACIKRAREALPNHTIIAGNVVTGNFLLSVFSDTKTKLLGQNVFHLP
jgi:hypothetical protein